MTSRSMSREEILALVPDLSDASLDALTEAGIVQPVLEGDAPRFRDIDAARLQLAVDLEDAFQLDADALALVLSLIDQLHGLKGEMRAVLSALAAEPPETRARLRGIIRETRILRLRRRR